MGRYVITTVVIIVMSSHIYPLYAVGCIMILILVITSIIYIVQWYKGLKRHFLLIKLGDVEEVNTNGSHIECTTADGFEVRTLSTSLFIMDSNRLLSCFGYVIFCAHPESLHLSNILLCHCKLIKFIGPNRKDSTESATQSNYQQVLGAKQILAVINKLEAKYIELSNTETLCTEVNMLCVVPFNTVCPICLIKFVLNEEIVLLFCNHGFHKDCLTSTLLQKESCPFCHSCSSILLYRKGEKMPSFWKSLCNHANGEIV